MKIILTGSNGLLGQKILDLALKNDAIDIICFSKGKDRYASSSKRYTYYDVDLANTIELERLLKLVNPHAVIHSAAITNVDYCENHVETCEQVNVEATKCIANYCALHKAHFTFLSTDFIFDGTKNELYTESDEAKPLSVYGRSKLVSEKYILAQPDLKATIARTCLVFGTAKELTRTNIALWAVGALKKGDALKIVNDQYRTPTLAEDLAWAVWELTLQEIPGVFNVSGPDYVSIIELIETVASVFDLSLENVESLSSKELNQPANRPPKTGFDLSKTKEAINYNPHSLQSALGVLRLQLEANN